MTEDKVQHELNNIQNIITQYNDGLITSHEMARMVASRALNIHYVADQGCDGLPANNILPDGTRDDGIVFVG